MIRSKAIRKGAQGEACTLNVAGVCNYNTESTVLAHLPDESHGMGLKADDIAGVFACSACHDWLDRRSKGDQSDRDWYMRRALVRTWRRLIDLGIVKVAA